MYSRNNLQKPFKKAANNLRAAGATFTVSKIKFDITI